jgi:acyl-CoA dehydrogenase
MTDEHRMLQDSVRRFFRALGAARGAWREAGMMPRETWNARPAPQGLLCLSMPEAYGGGGGDFGHEAVVILEQARANLSGFGGGLHSAIVAPYLCTAAPRAEAALPAAHGDAASWCGAIAMTEPGTGSDLQAVRTRRGATATTTCINGAKTFITNGQHANLIWWCARPTARPAAKGISLLLVETGDSCQGFRRGRKLDKVGLKAQDTSELFFDDVRVPAENLLGGEEGQGFFQLMEQLPQERLIIACRAWRDGARARRDAGLREAAQGLRQPRVGLPEHPLQAGRGAGHGAGHARLRRRLHGAHLKGELDAARAALAKCWVSEQQGKVMDECLQLFGGYGYMMEYPIAELYVDARVQRIYGGTNEIMKELASRSM